MSRSSLRPGYFRTPANFDSIPKARKELEDMAQDIDLPPNVAVCQVCNLTYWKPVGFCTNCRSHD